MLTELMITEDLDHTTRMPPGWLTGGSVAGGSVVMLAIDFEPGTWEAGEGGMQGGDRGWDVQAFLDLDSFVRRDELGLREGTLCTNHDAIVRH